MFWSQIWKFASMFHLWSWTKLDSFIWFTFLIGKLRILFVLVIREDSLESWRQLNYETSVSEQLRRFTWIGQSHGHNFQIFTRDLIMKQHDYLVFTVTRWFCQSSIGMCFWFFLGLYLNSLATVLVRMLVNAIMNPSDGVVKSFTGMYVLR